MSICCLSVFPVCLLLCVWAHEGTLPSHLNAADNSWVASEVRDRSKSGGFQHATYLMLQAYKEKKTDATVKQMTN